MRLIRLTAGAILVLATLSFFSGPAAAQDARIHLIHGIPDTNVDVAAGGDIVFPDFAFSETQDLSALAGATLENLQVKLAGTETVAIDAGDVTLPTSGNTTIIAHLDASGTPTLGIFDNDVSTVAAGEGRLIVRHTAFAPNVDIKANGAVAFPNVPNGAEGSVDLAAGTITAEVVPAGADSPVVIGPADLPIVEGEALIVYAVGSLDAGNLTVLTESISGLHDSPNLVNTGNSPVESSSSLGLVAAAAFAGLAVLGLGRRRLATVKA